MPLDPKWLNYYVAPDKSGAHHFCKANQIFSQALKSLRLWLDSEANLQLPTSTSFFSAKKSGAYKPWLYRKGSKQTGAAAPFNTILNA